MPAVGQRGDLGAVVQKRPADHVWQVRELAALRRGEPRVQRLALLLQLPELLVQRGRAAVVGYGIDNALDLAI